MYKSEKIFNNLSLTCLAASITACMNVPAPSESGAPIEELVLHVKKAFNGEFADRVLMFNPDAIGEWVFERNADLFPNVLKYAPFPVKMITAFPPKTPVCFGTMYTGAAPEIHGIQKYEKKVIKTESIFDVLVKAGKKVAIVAVQNSSMAKIFAGKDGVDYYICKYDNKVIEKTLELIEMDKYDFICVYNQEYDDAIHRSHPLADRAIRAIQNYNDSFGALAAKADESWKFHNTLITFSPDHGVHRMLIGLGNHGKFIPKDMNIIHYFGVQPRQEED